jgi:hypothetical protein
MPSKYDKVVKRLVKGMEQKEYVLTRINDGEEWHTLGTSKNKTDFLDNATSTDESTLVFNSKDGNKAVSMFLVLGNEFYETVSDYGWNTEQAKKDADEVTDEVSEFYENQSA